MPSSVDKFTQAVETTSIRKSAYIITKAPREWLRASLPKHLAFLKAVNNDDTDQLAALEREQVDRWERQVGVKPEETHFTVVVPIHNEEAFLPSFLGSILLADLPASADVHIIFITNACSDKSGSIIDEFLRTIDECTIAALPQNISDPAIIKTALTSRMGNITFSHIDTPTLGKANALNIGNTLALERHHRIAISVDANNFIEPDVFRHIFARAYHACSNPENTTVVISGVMKNVTTRTNLRVLFDRGRRIHNDARNNETFVNGWCMGWDTCWLQAIGGMPQFAIEDFALGVYARYDGKKTAYISEANIWGYNPNNIIDLVEQRARKIRGAYQMLESHPNLKNTIESDIYVLQRFVSKMRTLMRRIQVNPLAFPYYLADLAIWELAKQKGKHDYHKDPTNQSWKPIKSTKVSV